MAREANRNHGLPGSYGYEIRNAQWRGQFRQAAGASLELGSDIKNIAVQRCLAGT
jgi:hypothetical protein